MIFQLHYLLFSTGLPAVIVLLTGFLKAHSEASLSQVGLLLMSIPFVSIVVKPLVCALADRHQAHKYYLMGALTFMILGYGSLTVAPFFPDFIERHAQLVWQLDILGVVVGYGAFGVVFSLGDALAVNAAQVNGVSWGFYRAWAVVSWGVGGVIIGQLNDLTWLPKYTGGIFLLMAALGAEIVMLLFAPNKHFVMGGDQSGQQVAVDVEQPQTKEQEAAASAAAAATNQTHDNWQDLGGNIRSFHGTLTCRKLAGVLMDDLNGSLRSSLGRLSGATDATKKRTELSAVLDQMQAKQKHRPDTIKSIRSLLVAKAGDSASMGSLKSHKNLRLLDVKQLLAMEQQPPPPQELQEVTQPSIEDLQLVLLRLIVCRNATIWRYLGLFTLFGALFSVHLSYFFLHLDELCTRHGHEFSLVLGAMMLAHSVSEVVSFTLIVPYLVPRCGRMGSLLSCMVIFALRFLYYGTQLAEHSPFWALPFELSHGLAYGIIYSLITDIACDCVDQLDDYLPELVERGLIPAGPKFNSNLLKLPLRATMQGIFSGAYDGLGNGLGALLGGFYLDGHSFGSLWLFCTYICLAIIVVSLLAEFLAKLKSNKQ